MLMLSVFMKALEFISFAKEVKLNQDLIGICMFYSWYYPQEKPDS